MSIVAQPDKHPTPSLTFRCYSHLHSPFLIIALGAQIPPAKDVNFNMSPNPARWQCPRLPHREPQPTSCGNRSMERPWQRTSPLQTLLFLPIAWSVGSIAASTAALYHPSSTHNSNGQLPYLRHVLGLKGNEALTDARKRPHLALHHCEQVWRTFIVRC